MYITYLTPISSWASAAKTFAAPDRSKCTSDYNLGEWFSYSCEEYDTLEEFAHDMRSRENQIAIYGKPSELVALTGGKVQRRTVNFPYRDDHTLHCFDIDGWDVPEDMRQNVSMADPQAMTTLINDMLRKEGFAILADASKVITLSSSCWDLNQLNCHLYMEFSTPVRIEAMREFAIALAKIYQRKVFDDAIYKAVQPQFFVPPKCVGFVDPLHNARIFYAKGSDEHISTKDFQTLINTTLKKASWNPKSEASSLPTIGSDWLHTIKTCVGDEGGINQPCYRAAAQLVQSSGRTHVLASIDTFAEQMFNAVWETLTANGSIRGTSQKDKQTYDRARFRQYLKSATEKNFGDKVDQMVTQVQAAIDVAQEGDLSQLTSTPVVHSMALLKARHYNRFLPMENYIINQKLLKITQLSKLIKMGASAADDAPTEDGGTLIAGNPENENMLIDTVLARYDWIEDIQGNKFAAIPGNGDGGYRMLRVNGSLVDTFYSDGMEVSGNAVTALFGKKTLSMLMGRESRAIDSAFKQELIGTRVTPESADITSPTWLNLGKQTDGVFKAVKITADGVQLCNHRDSTVKWMFGTPPLYVATNEQIEERFGPDADLMDYLMETLPIYINTPKEDFPKVLMWLCAAIANKTLSYIAEIVGPAGTGKSSIADFMKDLIDPSPGGLGNGIDSTHFSGATDNFIADIERRYITILDNVSKLSPRDQDTLCTVATGLRHSERVLYTQTQMERMVQRPLIITSIAPVITRPDLQSRAVTIEATAAPFNLHFLRDWTTEKPFLVAALIQLTSKVLGMYNSVTAIPEFVNTRDVFLACVHSAVHGKDEVGYKYVINLRDTAAMEALVNVHFVGVFVAWMEEAYAEEDTAEISTRNLIHKLRSWCFANAGKDLHGRPISAAYLPSSGRGLGWELAKNIDIISRAGNWKYTGKVSRHNESRYRFERKGKEKRTGKDSLLDSLL